MSRRRCVDKESSYKPREPANLPELKARTLAQSQLIQALETQDVIFATGSAGTGKTYCCAAHAAIRLRNRDINRIVLTRPAVEAGEKLGYLPGEVEDKIGPYLRPYHDTFVRILGRGVLESAIKNGNIEGVAFAHLQGLTFDNCVVLVDEAENATCQQMELVLSRIGENSQIYVSGDIRQTYIKTYPGLKDALEVLADVPGVAHVHFDADDVVRSPLARRIVAAYEAADES